MFKGNPSPYDELVAKATDENQTGENWELILNICDKVSDEEEPGARNVIAALLKRLSHRNPNVQLYSLALAESLSKNCGIHVHREIASKSFTQLLERIVTDRTTHDKVKRKTLSMILLWTSEFQNDSSLGIMEECYDNLRSKGYKFEEEREPPPPQVDDEIRRKEEEELQRVLEMSMHDKGGRTAWDSYNNQNTNSNGAGPSNGWQSAGSSRQANSSAAASSSQPKNDYGYAKSSGGYVAARTPSPQHSRSASVTVAPTHTTRNSATASSTSSQLPEKTSQASLRTRVVSRVRALHSFDATEQGELSFEKGDIIKVVDRNYKDWWRGQLKGRTGIFPVNYIELLPDPTPEEISREAEQEAAVFAQAANIDKLLSMLRGLDPVKDNLADNEEIQELYRSSMSLRPKIVKLIDKYNQKRAELITMNESFVKARTMFDRMMEESLARHSGYYQSPDYPPTQYGPMYDQGYIGPPQAAQPYQAVSTPAATPQAYGPTGIYAGQQHPYPQGYPPQQGATPSPYGPVQPAQDPSGQYPPYGAYTQPPTGPQAQNQAFSQLQRHQSLSLTQSPGPVVPGTPARHDSLPEAGAFAQVQVQAQPPAQPHPQAQPPPQPHIHAQQQQPIQQNQTQAYPDTQSQVQAQRNLSAQHRHITETEGPPYVYDPNATYADPNVQAWAAYYAQGGTDKTGAVYFTSVPGLTDAAYATQSPLQGATPLQQHAVQQERTEYQNGASMAPSAGPVPVDGVGN